MPRANNRSAFPFKKEATIGAAIWLTYAAPAAVLFLRPKPQVAQWCWIAVGAATVFIVLPLLYRMWLTWPVSGAPTAAPAPDYTETVEAPVALPRPAELPRPSRRRVSRTAGGAVIVR
jgi:hypothetical protein